MDKSILIALKYQKKNIPITDSKRGIQKNTEVSGYSFGHKTAERITWAASNSTLEGASKWMKPAQKDELWVGVPIAVQKERYILAKIQLQIIDELRLLWL